jgi:putative NADH-flavin reductase
MVGYYKWVNTLKTTSYFYLKTKKMQKLHILVGGASGAVGEGLVEEFLKKGHYVTAILRGKDKKENLQKVIGERNLHEAKLDFIINSFHSEEEIGMLR